MIFARVPFRVSLFGGGTDFKEFYKAGLGSVVSMAINKYMYVTLNQKFDGRLHLRYSKTEVTDDVEDLQHTIVKECLRYFGIKKGIEVAIISDLPSVGTGLGSSSALTAAVLGGLFSYTKQSVDKASLARLVCEIEIDRLGAPIGKQDQYAVVYGGFKKYEFYRDESVSVTDLYNEQKFEKLLNSLLLVYLPNGRKSNKILKIYRKSIEEHRHELNLHLSLVSLFVEKWSKSTLTADVLGDMLNRAWKIKQKSSPASSPMTDKVYEMLILKGVFGAKMCGAGQGGFMLAACPVHTREWIGKCMSEEGYIPLEIGLDQEGFKVLYNDGGVI